MARKQTLCIEELLCHESRHCFFLITRQLQKEKIFKIKAIPGIRGNGQLPDHVTICETDSAAARLGKC